MFTLCILRFLQYKIHIHGSNKTHTIQIFRFESKRMKNQKLKYIYIYIYSILFLLFTDRVGQNWFELKNPDIVTLRSKSNTKLQYPCKKNQITNTNIFTNGYPIWSVICIYTYIYRIIYIIVYISFTIFLCIEFIILGIRILKS